MAGSQHDVDLLQFVQCLFADGLLIKDIASVVRQHGYQLSDRHLRRLPVKLGLRRRCFSDAIDVAIIHRRSVGRFGSLTWISFHV